MLSRSCTKKIQISNKSYKRKLRLVYLLSGRVIYSRKTSYAFPLGPLRDLLVREADGGALATCFGLNKTIDILKEHFYWPQMGSDVHEMVQLIQSATKPRVRSTKGCVLHYPY